MSARDRRHDVLAGWDSPSWDDLTRAVVHARLHDVPPRRFLDAGRYRTLVALCGRVVPQPDRPGDPVPIAPWVDHQLAEGVEPGYRYAGMPAVRDVWIAVLDALDAAARARHGAPFAALADAEADRLLHALQRAELDGPPWDRLDARRCFDAVVQQVVGIYYAHPAAWSECGYGGPASPRGYVRLGPDERDPWEGDAHRA